LCRALAKRQHPQGCGTARERKSIIHEERETKAAGAAFSSATSELTILRLVPREPKGRGSSDERFH
jgi:hypothetical protein